MRVDKTEAYGRVRPATEQGGRNLLEADAGVEACAAAAGQTKSEELRLMEAAVERGNMLRAYERVLRNKGAPGVDGRTVSGLKDWLKTNWPQVRQALLTGDYMPSAVRKVEIPKPNGAGVRTLGIPTVADRLIQQALHQVLQPIFEPEFSESSYGFRAGRGAHDAVQAARGHAAQNRRWVVDLDLEKFFDRVNHDILMSRLARKIGDGRVLKLIRRYLEAGLMESGIATVRTEGTPQGGPLSPLLSNILLTDLDRELERRGHCFCRYADDCNIYVRTQIAAERVMAGLTRYLEGTLKLKVNREKSAVARPWQRKFLGYTISMHLKPKLWIAQGSRKRLADKVRQVFTRARGQRLQTTIEALNPVLRGWANYFSLTDNRKVLEEFDGWIRHKLRTTLWRHWKRSYARARNLMQRGLSEQTAWCSATNGRGPWWNGSAAHMNRAYPKRWFDQMRLVSLLDTVQRLQRVS